MARIIGGLTTSHIPAIANAIAKGLYDDPYWQPFFAAYPPVRDWLAQEKPDVAAVIYNDHGLNFFLDKQPTFAIGAAPEYRNEDEGWGIPTIPPFKGAPAFSWHLIESLVAQVVVDARRERRSRGRQCDAVAGRDRRRSSRARHRHRRGGA